MQWERLVALEYMEQTVLPALLSWKVLYGDILLVYQYQRDFKKKTQLSKRLMDSIPNWSLPGTNDNEDPALIAQDWLTIKHTMWNYVGIARTTSRLKRAREDLNNLSKRLYEFYRNTPISKNLIDLFHGCQSSIIITNAAYRNTKTVGCHFRVNK